MTDNGYSAVRTTAAVYPRGKVVYEVTGAGRQRLLSYALARATEYAQPGTIVDTLALDDDGRPIDFVLAIIDESRALLLSDNRDGVLPQLSELATHIGIDDVECRELEGWSGTAVEGPKSWLAIQDLFDEDIAGVLLNEWREIGIPDAEAPAILARTGTTAEYGYVLVGSCPSETLVHWLLDKVEAFGGSTISEDALIRARLEVNHPILPEQFDGISVREAGASWLAGLGREDDFRGKLTPAPLERRVVAVRSEAELVPGTDVQAGDTVVGRIHLVAPRLAETSTVALALLERPFDVPGLALTAGEAQLATISRPAVKPISWTEAIE